MAAIDLVIQDYYPPADTSKPCICNYKPYIIAIIILLGVLIYKNK